MSQIATSNLANILVPTKDDLNALVRGEPKLGAIPNPTPDLQSLTQVAQAMKTILEVREGRNGSKVDQNVTWRDLFTNGMMKISVNGEVYQSAYDSSVSVPTGGVANVTPPPAPAHLSASGALVSNILTWDKPIYSNHSYAKVFRASTDAIGTAVMIGTTQTDMYVDTVGSAATNYYWVKFVSTASIDGPFNGTSGTLSQTGNDPVVMLSLLTGDPSSSPYYGQFPFIVQKTPTVINGVSVPAGVYMRDAFIANGTISNAMIGNAAIDSAKIANAAITTAHIQNAAINDAQIGNVSADKIRTGTLAVDASISVGTTIEGKPALVFNGQGEVISNGVGGSKARFYSGNVEIYKNVPIVGVVKYKALSRVEVGVADNNVQVTIPGYFISQPKIIVSPFSIGLYKSAYSNQDQSLNCQAQSIVETPTGSMVWAFTPVATLTLSSNSGSTIVNQSSGVVSVGWTSSQYATSANCSSITPTVYLASNRGNGSSQYYYRSVRWRVEYLNAGSWVLGAWNTYNLGADAAASISTNAVFTFPSSAAWTFRIYYESFDTNATVFGATSYNYATDTVSNSTASGIVTSASTDMTNVTNTLSYTIGTYSTPSGWQVTGVSYSYTYNFYLSSSYSGGGASVTGPGLSQSISGAGTLGSSAMTVNNTATYSTGSWSAGINLTISAQGGGVSTNAQAKARIVNATASISRRQPVANSTTPQDQYRFDSYNYTLTSAQVLATGSLNWVAVGD